MIRFVLYLLVVIVLNKHSALSDIVLADFQQEALAEHNVKRQIHCVRALTMNSTLNTVAQNYAEYLRTNNLFNHSYTSGLGENLFKLIRTNAITYINGSRPTDTWYNETVNYNYSVPDYSPGTAHFTQIVWKNTVQMGIGIALSSDNKTAWVVAEYYPAGNVEGEFADNVLAPCYDNARGD